MTALALIEIVIIIREFYAMLCVSLPPKKYTPSYFTLCSASLQLTSAYNLLNVSYPGSSGWGVGSYRDGKNTGVHFILDSAGMNCLFFTSMCLNA